MIFEEAAYCKSVTHRFFQCTVNAGSVLKHIHCCIQGQSFIFEESNILVSGFKRSSRCSYVIRDKSQSMKLGQL